MSTLNRLKKGAVFTFLLVLLLSACRGQPAHAGNQYKKTAIEKEVQTLAAGTLAAATLTNTAPQPPTLTATVSEPTATASSTPATLLQVEATVNANQSPLRAGPGSMFITTGNTMFGSVVTITGLAQGREWAFVSLPGQQTGWMDLRLLTPAGNLKDVPIQPFEGSYMISGVVQEADGTRIAGVELALCNGYCYQGQRTDSTSDVNGEFRFYVPPEKTEALHVELISVACGSPIMAADCRLPGTFAPTSIALRELPQTAPLFITYKK